MPWPLVQLDRALCRPTGQHVSMNASLNIKKNNRTAAPISSRYDERQQLGVEAKQAGKNAAAPAMRPTSHQENSGEANEGAAKSGRGVNSVMA